MGRSFDITHWSAVLAARDRDDSEGRAALEELCAAYWQPLYGFVRRSGHSAEDAADLVQSYFARFLEKRFLDDVTPERGRFRSFLLVSMRHFLANEWDRRRAAKRQGDLTALLLDFLAAERGLAGEPKDERTPEEEFERRWALATIDRAIAARLGQSETAVKVAVHRLRKRFGEGLRATIAETVADRREVDDELKQLLRALG